MALTPRKGGVSERRLVKNQRSAVRSRKRVLTDRDEQYLSSPQKRRKVGLTDAKRATDTGGDPLFNYNVTHDIAVNILKYLPLHELSEKMCLVCKRWHKLIFNAPQLWELVIISRDEPRTPLAAAARVSWLATCKVRDYIKDLNIALTMTYTDIKVLAKLKFPMLREFSVDIAQDNIAVGLG